MTPLRVKENGVLAASHPHTGEHDGLSREMIDRIIFCGFDIMAMIISLVLTCKIIRPLVSKTHASIKRTVILFNIILMV